jgi:transketolase
MISGAGYGFAGSCLSVADVLAALSVSWRIATALGADRGAEEPADVLCLSKGHAAPALYATLLGAQWRSVGRYAALGSALQGHPHRTRLAGIPATAGSLGLAPALAVGAHLGARRRGRAGRLAVVVGDGEIQSGQALETLTWLAESRIPGVLVIVDHNGMQSTGRSGEASLRAVAAAFGDPVRVDGHDASALLSAFDAFTSVSQARLVVAVTRRWAGVTLPDHSPQAMSHLPDPDLLEVMIRELYEEAGPEEAWS